MEQPLRGGSPRPRRRWPRATGPRRAAAYGTSSRSFSVPPGTYSRTRYSQPSASPTSWSRTTFSCRKRRERSPFAEPSGVLARAGRRAAAHDLQRHQAAEARLPRQVDDAHAPAAQLALDHEPGDLRPLVPAGRSEAWLRFSGRVVPHQPIQLGLAAGTALDVPLERGEGPVPERVGPEPGQRGGGRAGDHG